ncbi:MAG: DUF4340 domain-containing protein [Deltaproteobacteria bacterium]|jgi:hypothetical protein|nr:DUF4340 domain-containing protein [Deltaproteobacteria bacterium]MBW2497940.1 DUF4340 domain-containing protein [Deltaproteobacteria bacterium]
MNPRTTIVLALVAAALGAFIWFYEIEGESTRQAAEDEEKRVFAGLESTDVGAVSFVTMDGIEARFERREGRWEVVRPVSGRADASALDAIVGALANLPREGEVDSPGELEEFGLGSDAQRIYFEVEGEAKGLRIGRSTPVGGHRYVARLADDEVAYVASYRLNAFNRNLLDLRDRRVFRFDAGEVVGLRIAWPQGVVELLRDDAGSWQMLVPAAERADDERVRELLSDLSFLRVQSFLDAPEPDEAVAAASRERAIEIQWTLRGEEGVPGEAGQAWIGGEIGAGRLLSGPEGGLYTIASERLEDIDRDVAAYRYKTLSEYDVEEAGRLRLRFVEGADGAPAEVVAELVESGWISDDERLDLERVADLVLDLGQLRAEDILADEMGEAELASLGLAPPQVVIAVEARTSADEEPAVLAQIALGRVDDERGLFAQRLGASTVYVLDADLAEDLPTSWTAFAAGFRRSLSEAAPGAEGEGASQEGGEELESVGEDPMTGIDLP